MFATVISRSVPRMSQPAHTRSVISDHLDLHLPEGMRARLERLALSRGTSLEAEAIRALEAHLLNESRLSILALALEAKQEQATPRDGNMAEIDYLDGLGRHKR